MTALFSFEEHRFFVFENGESCHSKNQAKICRKIRSLNYRSFFDIYTVFYENIFYKNIEAEICEILRIF